MKRSTLLGIFLLLFVAFSVTSCFPPKEGRRGNHDGADRGQHDGPRGNPNGGRGNY